MNKGKILLVEDQMLFRKGLLQLLERDLEGYQIDESTSTRAAFRMLKETEYSAVVTDLCFPQEDGLWLLSKLKEAGRQVPVLVVTATERLELLSRAVEVGAGGIVVKRAQPSELLQGVRCLLDGEKYLPPDLIAQEPQGVRLNSRAVELLCHCFAGSEPEEIRDKMSLSMESFTSLVNRVCCQLGVTDMARAASTAHRLGLIAGQDHG